ncbi:hypothetical protein BGZ65_011942 [Modicella reniformis]|uniref:RNA polymerase I-specific transcription initiation factor RRN3 n=1 Tax=Modicella reniformis TaxID=1440133 RepID=A0A9P6IMW5_9FUNG|nr:hypothetical protein BGZ65_011942 [Modicella reniformis]
MPVSHSPSEATAVAASKVTFTSDLTASTLASDSITSPGHRKRSSRSDIIDSTNFPMKRSAPTPAATVIPTEQAAVDLERQRQGQIMMTSYISSAIREKKQGNPIPFKQLITQLTVTEPAPLTPAKMLQWIQAMSQCISLLDKSCSTLIDAMLQINWIVQDDAFVRYYMSFLGNVVSAHGFYVVPVQSMLVKKLTSRYKSPLTENVLLISRERQFDRAHQVLMYVLDLIPTGPTSLFPLLAGEFPHKRESISTHITFVKNILRILDYAPVLRAQILSVVIDRIIQIDVEIQVELEEIENSDTEVVYDVDVANEDDKDEDDDDSDGEDGEDDSDSDSEAAEVTVLNIKEMTQKLDGILFLVFSYLERYVNSCRDLPASNGHPPLPIQELFLELLSIFMKTILQTFKSRHTQFLLFYYISLSHQFSDYFLGALGQQILDKAQPEVARVAAAAYMSSFVARAKYLDVRQIGMVVDMLGGFALETAQQVDTGSLVVPDGERYPVFYATVQALLYIFCFRWKVLVIGGGGGKLQSNKVDFDSAGMIVGSMDGNPGSNSGVSTIRQWHAGLASLQPVVSSRLNPLKICSSNVVKQFARLSNNLDFMYVYPILEQNKTLFMHGRSPSYTMGNGMGTRSDDHYNNNGATLPHELETFFPFDPFRLRQSGPFMRGIYQEWEDDGEDDDEDDEDEEEDYDEYGEEEGEEDQDEGREGRRQQSTSKDDHDEDEDDDEDDGEGELEVNSSIIGMSISPSPAHFLVQGLTKRIVQ